MFISSICSFNMFHHCGSWVMEGPANYHKYSKRVFNSYKRGFNRTSCKTESNTGHAKVQLMFDCFHSIMYLQYLRQDFAGKTFLMHQSTFAQFCLNTKRQQYVKFPSVCIQEYKCKWSIENGARQQKLPPGAGRSHPKFTNKDA